MFFSAKKRDSLSADLYMTVAGHQIQPSSCVRSLGVIFDCNLRMEQQIANIVKVCYYQIRNIGQIRPHLTNESCKILVHALVMSRLDYGNSLLYGLPNNTMQRRQKVQNCAARKITLTKKYDHITPVLQRLHWLPVNLRPAYKVLPFTYCALNGVAPDYLSELFSYRHVNRTLRSASQPPLLSIPASQTVNHGDHRFAVCWAVLWNNMPFLIRTTTTVKSFKTLLKTHLFRQAFL